LKIAFLLPDLRGGGAERVCLDLAYEFAKCGHRVELLVMQSKGELLEEARDHFDVTNLNCSRVRDLLIALPRHLKSTRPDAILAAMWPLTVIAAIVGIMPGSRCKVIISEHGILSAQYAAWGPAHRFILRSSMALGYRISYKRVAVSDGVAKDLAALSGMPLSSFDVIHNPVSSRPLPSNDEIRQANALWATPPGARILNIGSFKPVKNHALLLHAFARVKNPNARLMLVGTGQGEARLRALSASLGISGRVIFTGFHPNPTVYYMTSDLFALSSNYEGFGNVIVEAMACGTPIVATDCPSGPAEILEDGRYGRLVPVNDQVALAAAIHATLGEAIDREPLKRRAAAFSPAIAAKKYLKLLGL
jgi:glycosyltransferase involved in cell wall biosynthesis|tara:strand:+ start:30235 stop:31323 length:1089 start_codon:yes stop_codon:yes gene_type:complete